MDIPLSIAGTQNDLFSKKYSTTELVDSYLNRIKTFDKKLNSFITIAADYAYKKAKWTDKIIADNGKLSLQNYPLLGVTIAFKDLFLTKGLRTTAASNVLRDYIPQYSATVVVKLENAGCIVLGKLNCDAWAHGSSGENSDFGASKNPWNEKFIPGGSSSGSGAALAANFSLVTTGTDTCGSIRLPANYCYKVGLKPTYGRVSRYGIIAMASSLDSIGHLTHTVADSEKILAITEGEDGKDATVKNIKDPSEVKDVTDLKIGIPKEFFIEGLDKEVERSVMDSIGIFKKAKIEFKEVSLPLTKYAISVYYIIQPAEVSSNLGRYDGIRYGNDRTLFGDEAKRRIMLGTYVLSSGYYDAYYLKAMKVRSKIIQNVEDTFSKVDAIIAPVAPTPPFKIGERIDDPLTMYLTDIFAATANLSGIPAISIPSGFTKGGLPLGFQIMAPRFREDILFKLGNIYEKESGYEPLCAKFT